MEVARPEGWSGRGAQRHAGEACGPYASGWNHLLLVVGSALGGNIAVILAGSAVEHRPHPVMVDEGGAVGVFEDLVAPMAGAGDVGVVVEG